MNEDENAFRFINRVKAAIGDYEAGRMSLAQLVDYTRRTSIEFGADAHVPAP